MLCVSCYASYDIVSTLIVGVYDNVSRLSVGVCDVNFNVSML